MVLRILAMALVMIYLQAPVWAQAPTGTISGRVVSADGAPLPGATVSAMSTNLQGVRTAVTSDNGDYLIPLLPPGDYTVSFEIGDFQTVRQVRSVAGTQTAVLDVTMMPAAQSVTVHVVADAQPFVRTAQVATNFKQSLMSTLPSTRTLDAALLLAPAIHATGPRGAVTINGAQSYENLFTLNGAVITENLRGSPFTLYIEDALQETTVASAGISAEFGRFEGGVANVVTKSGGNVLSGSFRSSFANDSWRSYTPFEASQLAKDPSAKLKIDKTVPTFEATVGGPVTKERLWYFGALRKQKQESTRTTAITNIPYVRTNDEERYEGKLTYAIKPGHSLQGAFFKVSQVLHNNTNSVVADLASLTDQGQPQELLTVHYTGVVGPNLFVEAQYSDRRLTLTKTGASTRDRIDGTLLFDSQRGFRYWSPTFCSGDVCDGDEERNNSDFIVKGSYFASDRAAGSHHVVFGYDRFHDKIKANTHGSGSDFRIRGFTHVVGTTVYPRWLPGQSFIDYTPIAQLSEGTDLRTDSLFVNDRWRLNDRFSFNLGLRFDNNHGIDGGGQRVGAGSTWSPRLAAIWDPKGDGTWSVSGSSARYVMALNNNLAGSTTKAGNTSALRWVYTGPAINPTADGNLVSTDEALRQFFQWFDSAGGINMPPIAASVPGVNMVMREPLTSPYSIEYGGGLGRTLGSRGTARIDAVYREYRNFYSLRTDLSTGQVADEFGNRFDLNVVENTDATERRYLGLVTQASYTFGEQLSAGGNYTLSHAYGNLEGETVNQGPSGGLVDNYPEYRRESWNHPQGDLLIDQRHRATIWGTYRAPLSPSLGSLTFGLIQTMASGVPYSAIGIINPTSFVANPGYLTPPSQLEYFFSDRGAFRTETSYRTDISVNYAYRLASGGGPQPELFFHGQLMNVFREFQLCGCGDSVFTNGGATNLLTIQQGVRVIAPFNPFTAQPVHGVNWDYNSNFGGPLNAFAFTSPRMFRFSVGVRF